MLTGGILWRFFLSPNALPPPPFIPQSALSLLPNISVDPLPDALFSVSNDEHLSMFIASLGRSVTALHDLLTNKSAHAEAESRVGVDDKKADDKATDAKAAAGADGKEKKK